jgi:hypothetical protein
MRPLSYLTWLGGTFFALTCLAVALGVAVDPYRMYATPTVPGWTALKPRINNQTGIAKTYQLERVRPATLLLGNSRVEIGFDPESPSWPATAYPIFNAAVAGGDLGTSLLMLRDADAVRALDTIMLGLDFLDFLQKPSDPASPQGPVGPNERRLLVDRDGHPNPERPLQIWRDRIGTTLTIDAVLDALATPFDQDPETSTTMTPLGFNPLHEYRVFAARQGYYELFAQKNAIYRRQYQRYPKPDFLEPLRYASFRQLQAIVALATAQAEHLILFIHPYHADYLDMLHDVGLWQSFENWKRALAKFVDNPGPAVQSTVQLFDFSDYNEFTTERVPPSTDRHTIMRWYWEAGHYKPALGEEMLETMLGGVGRFGFVLTSTTVEHVLAEIQKDRYRFAERDRPRS